MKKFLVFFFIVVFNYYLHSQEQAYAVETIAFYNVENLFDYFDDPEKWDDDRTPTGRDKWTAEIFEKIPQRMLLRLLAFLK